MVAETGGSPVFMSDGGGMGAGGMGFWGFLILAMFLFGGSGGNLFGGGNSNAIQNDINRGFDNQNLQAQTRDILNQVTSGTAQQIAASTANASNAITAIKDGNAALIREFGNVETALSALSGKQQECCCNILRATDGINYANALNTAAIQKTIVEEAQKNRDMFLGARMTDLQTENSFLRTQNLLGNVVRYPTAATFTAGPSPFCNCGTGFVA